MENQEMSLAVQNEKGLFEVQESKVFCSMPLDTNDQKVSMLNALESCDVLLNDCVGQEIKLKDIYCEEKERIDEKTGEIKIKYRTILFDENGQTYATASYGIYNILKKIFQIYGTPNVWDSPKIVEVVKRPIGDGKTALTLKLKKGE